MDLKKLFKYSAILLFTIFLLNYLALQFYWYSSIWYLDMILHFMGGIWLGFISIYLFKFNYSSLSSLFRILLIVLFVGIGWEIFEILINNLITQDNFNTLDTLSDLFFDTAGGAFAIFYFLKKIMSINKNTV